MQAPEANPAWDDETCLELHKSLHSDGRSGGNKGDCPYRKRRPKKIGYALQKSCSTQNQEVGRGEDRSQQESLSESHPGYSTLKTLRCKVFRSRGQHELCAKAQIQSRAKRIISE